MKLQQGNIFRSVCQEFCPQGGVCMAGGMCGSGTCMAGGMHGRGYAWRGRHAWQGGHVWGVPGGGVHGRKNGNCSGWYASYWNAFLFWIILDLHSHVLLISANQKSKVNWCRNKGEFKYVSINTCQLSSVTVGRQKSGSQKVQECYGLRFNPL